MSVIPEVTDIRPESIAIVAWDDGGAGQIHSWIEETGFHVACFVNTADTPPDIDIKKQRAKRETSQFDIPTRDSFKGLPLISASDWPDVLCRLGLEKVLIITPEPQERSRNIQLAREKGLELVNAINPTVTILPDAIIGSNVVLFARAVIGYRAEVHDGVIVNTGSQIDHHNVLHQCAHLDPGVTMAGNVVVERLAVIHTGATVINNIRIGEGAIVGAGAVVVNDVLPWTTVVGVPARAINLPETKKEG